MTLPLYFDHHIPSSVVRALRLRGVDVLTAAEDGRADASDEELLTRAMGLGRTVVTQDRDFRILATQWQRAGHHFPGAISIAGGGFRLGPLIESLTILSLAGGPEDVVERVIYVPM